MKYYHITTIGCQMNKSDSEKIKSYLNNIGYKNDKLKTPDLAIFVTCGVRQSAEDKILSLIPKTKKKYPNAKIILTGCLSKRKDVKRKINDFVDIWLPITDLPILAEKIGISMTCNTAHSYYSIEPQHESKFSAFIPIGNGCDNFCSYCVVPYARGRENYRSISEILNEINVLLKKGYKEITLIAQNVNSYKSKLNADCKINNVFLRKGKYDFSDLLQSVAKMPGKFWLRFATSHPKDVSAKLINVMAGSPKICRHIHLPAQSGDNEILAAMNRKYTREHYLELVTMLRDSLNKDQNKPPVSITTDIIVGYPGETDESFINTMRLFTEVGFDIAYVSQYSPRPETTAYRLADDTPKFLKKKREEVLMDIIRNTNAVNNQWYQDKTLVVLVVSVNKKGLLLTKTETGKTVKIKIGTNTKGLIGKFINVKIIKTRDFGLDGKIVN